jgi:hypothetical protein
VDQRSVRLPLVLRDARTGLLSVVVHIRPSRTAYGHDGAMVGLTADRVDELNALIPISCQPREGARAARICYDSP